MQRRKARSEEVVLGFEYKVLNELDSVLTRGGATCHCQTDASRVYELMGEGHPACETDSEDLLSTRVTLSD